MKDTFYFRCNGAAQEAIEFQIDSICNRDNPLKGGEAIQANIALLKAQMPDMDIVDFERAERSIANLRDQQAWRDHCRKMYGRAA